MPIDFNVRPRHVEMFGAQGVLLPLYQRQAAKAAVESREDQQRHQTRMQQARFEQAKALSKFQENLRQTAPDVMVALQRMEQDRDAEKLQYGFTAEEQRGVLGYQTEMRDIYSNESLSPEQKDAMALDLYDQQRMMSGEGQRKMTLYTDPETLETREHYGPVNLRYQQPAGGAGGVDDRFSWANQKIAYDSSIKSFGTDELTSDTILDVFKTDKGIKKSWRGKVDPGTISQYLQSFMGPPTMEKYLEYKALKRSVETRRDAGTLDVQGANIVNIINSMTGFSEWFAQELGEQGLFDYQEEAAEGSTNAAASVDTGGPPPRIPRPEILFEGSGIGSDFRKLVLGLYKADVPVPMSALGPQKIY